jgi:hypothetical protein
MSWKTHRLKNREGIQAQNKDKGDETSRTVPKRKFRNIAHRAKIMRVTKILFMM